MEGGVRALLAKVGDDEKLIEEVRVYECLWKVTSMAYKDLRAKENSWKIVAEKLKCYCIRDYLLFADTCTIVILYYFLYRLVTRQSWNVKGVGRASVTSTCVK